MRWIGSFGSPALKRLADVHERAALSDAIGFIPCTVESIESIGLLRAVNSPNRMHCEPRRDTCACAVSGQHGMAIGTEV